MSILDLFTIGIGPSASHTVAPMRAARRFVQHLHTEGKLSTTTRIQITLQGSLAYTGRGHGTDKALVLGLHGAEPHTVGPDYLRRYYDTVVQYKKLTTYRGHEINFDNKTDLRFDFQKKAHNTMIFVAYDSQGQTCSTKTYRSTGGGFITSTGETLPVPPTQPYPFTSAAELINHCEHNDCTIATLTLKNELALHTQQHIDTQLEKILATMHASIQQGIHHEGYLPGKLRVKRRAPALYRRLQGRKEEHFTLSPLDWVNLYAIAVNEENASGERVVAAPTNGASGIIPAVLGYYDKFCHGANLDGKKALLLTAGSIGLLYKMNASLSGAEVGCQGEVGTACSMAAAGLTAVLSGTMQQVEEAAEIAIEHNLGLTCDPIGGLVQIPCIERNAMGAVKAINASRLALQGSGKHKVSLDSAIKTMKQTGLDMQSKYKETSRGGLAVNVTEC